MPVKTELSPPNCDPNIPVRTAEQPAMMYAMAVRDKWLALMADLAMDCPLRVVTHDGFSGQPVPVRLPEANQMAGSQRARRAHLDAFPARRH